MTDDLERTSDDLLLAGIAGGEGRRADVAVSPAAGRRLPVRAAHERRGGVADDVTQDVFLVVMRKRDAISRGDRRSRRGCAGLRGTACGSGSSGTPGSKAWTATSRPTRGQLPIVQIDPMGDLARGERIAALRRAVLALPVRYREVVVLCDLEELSYADAADALGCAIGTVRSRLHRARAMLAARLAALQEHGGSATPRRDGPPMRR